MWGFAIPAAVGLGSSLLGASASRRAASAAAGAADRATEAQQAMYDQTRTDLAPFREAGAGALPTLVQQVGTGFQESPGYRFAFDEGVRAVDSAAAARGMLGSGARLRALTQYGQGVANQEYGNWYARLAGLAGMGQNAAAQTGSAGANAASGIGQAQIAGGQAQAAGIVGGTSAALQGVNQGLGLWALMNRPAAVTPPRPAGT